MRAMANRGPGRVRIEEKDIPAIEHPNDAIVRVTCAAICGSDLHLYHGMMPDLRIGHTFGHEFVGVVHEVGLVGRAPAAGDRVVVPFNIFCGSCFFCARGLYSNCHNVNPNATAVGGIYGYSHTLRRLRRRPGGVRARAVRGRRPEQDPGVDGRRGRRAAHRRLPDRVFRRAARATSAKGTWWWCSAPGRSGSSLRSRPG